MVEPILARMNCGALIPVPAIYFDVVGHVKSMRLIRKPRKKRPALPSSFSKRPLPLLALFGTAAVVAACPLLNDEPTRANRRVSAIEHTHVPEVVPISPTRPKAPRQRSPRCYRGDQASGTIPGTSWSAIA